MPSIQAYSGVSQPIKAYNGSGTINLVGSTSTTTTQTYTSSFTVTQNGIVQGFLATAESSSATIGNASAYAKYTIKRNGATITSQTGIFTRTDIYPNSYAPGTMFYETLNMLAGAEVYAGEIFTMEIEVSLPASNPIHRYNETHQMNLIIKAQGSQIIIP